MAADELHNSLPLEPAGGPDHGLERQPEIVGDVRFAHRQRDVAMTVRRILFPQQTQQHREPADGIAPSNDDVVVLRLTQHVNRLAQELRLDVRVVREQLRQRIDVDLVRSHRA